MLRLISMKNFKYLELTQALSLFLMVASIVFIKERIVSIVICMILSFLSMIINFIFLKSDKNNKRQVLINTILSIAGFLLFFYAVLKNI